MHLPGFRVAPHDRAGGRVERERCYLLAGVPPRAEDAPAEDIDQGWLPGDVVRERVRRVRAAGRERYWRGLEQGAGPQRLEAQEETTREVFEALWALTAGRRLAIRRRRIDDGGLGWMVDQFADRDLVLARVQLPPHATDAAIPDWLGPFAVREVTDDPAYKDDALAAGTQARAAQEDCAAPGQPVAAEGPASAAPEPNGAAGR